VDLALDSRPESFHSPAMITNDVLARGRVIAEPPGREAGYWVGAPGVFHDDATGTWYLTYRLRRPRGVQPDRGGEVRVARSTDLERWEDVLTVTKDRHDSASIERSCLQRGRDGGWRYVTSFVHPSDGRWCTAVCTATDLAKLNPSRHRIVFTGPPLGLEGVKDPWILEHGGVYHLFLSVATPTPQTGADSHATRDIFNTGECKSATALATSRDLDNWEWQGVVFAPGATGWDCYCRRLNSAVPLTGGGFVGFYDGSASHRENYEEKCALAVSADLRSWRTLSPQGPRFTSPHASTSLRYVDARFARGRWHLFYEYARPDGSHDLRVITCGQSEIDALAADRDSA
jgi:hypothetical protein